jgi:hypothetical protein
MNRKETTKDLFMTCLPALQRSLVNQFSKPHQGLAFEIKIVLLYGGLRAKPRGREQELYFLRLFHTTFDYNFRAFFDAIFGYAAAAQPVQIFAETPHYPDQAIASLYGTGSSAPASRKARKRRIQLSQTPQARSSR